MLYDYYYAVGGLRLSPVREAFVKSNLNRLPPPTLFALCFRTRSSASRMGCREEGATREGERQVRRVRRCPVRFAAVARLLPSSQQHKTLAARVGAGFINTASDLRPPPYTLTTTIHHQLFPTDILRRDPSAKLSLFYLRVRQIHPTAGP